MSVKIMRRLCAPLVALLLAGCANLGPLPAKDNYVAPGINALPAQSLIVILPIVGPEHDYTKGEVMALGQLRTQLEAAGYRVAGLGKANYELVWGQEAAAAGGVYDPVTGALRPEPYAQAMSNLARRVCEETKCALLLRYRLVLREALQAGQTADWDGQRRRVPVSSTGGSDYVLSGGTPAISLELLAMTGGGELAFKTYGGASLPFRANGAAGKFDLRTELFQNDVELADAVRLAIAPIIRH